MPPPVAGDGRDRSRGRAAGRGRSQPRRAIPDTPSDYGAARATGRSGERSGRSATASRSTGCGSWPSSRCRRCPFATQLLARLGADVVKVEHPVDGDLGRGALPAMDRPRGPAGRRHVPAQQPQQAQRRHRPEGSARVATSSCALAGEFDVVAENFKAGALARLGLGYDDVVGRPSRLSSTCRCPGSAPGRRRTTAGRRSRRRSRPCRASTSSSGEDDDPPVVARPAPSATSAPALFATIGVLAALRHRDRTGIGPTRRRRHVRLADRPHRPRHQLLVDGLCATKSRPLILPTGSGPPTAGSCVQVGRPYQFAAPRRDRRQAGVDRPIARLRRPPVAASTSRP